MPNNLTIKFYSRGSISPIVIQLPGDVVEIQVPPFQGRPALSVSVNADMVVVDTLDGQRVGSYDYQYEIDAAVECGEVVLKKGRKGRKGPDAIDHAT